MFVVDGQKIEITRGDTGMYTITFTGEDAPEDGSTILVSLKKTKISERAIWEKRLAVQNNAASITLTSADTNLPFGQYWWDARIIFRDGTVYTPMYPASFKIVEVIGDAG